MKKLIAIVTIFLLVLAGCSSDDNVQPTNTSNTNSTPSTSVISANELGSSYKIGTDIPAGEYYIVATGEPSPDYGNLKITIAYLSSVPLETADESDITAMIPVSNNAYLTVNESDGYLFLAQADAYPANNKPDIVVNSDGSYNPGMYKVGTDIPAGSYTLEPLPNTSETGFLITKDSKSYMSYYDDPSTTIASGYLEEGSSQSITLENGQYLNSGACKIIPE